MRYVKMGAMAGMVIIACWTAGVLEAQAPAPATVE